MRKVWLAILLVLALLATSAPAHAEIETIEPPDEAGTPEPLLEPAEVEKIEQLQSTFFYQIASPVSPDDQAMLVVFAELLTGDSLSLGMLNINDGSFMPTDFFIERFIPISTFEWRDERTLVAVGVDFFASETPIALLSLDRFTGAATYTPLPQLIGFPISISPTGRQLLLVLDEELEEVTDEAGSTPEASPFDIEVRVRPEPVNDQLSVLSSMFDDDEDVLRVASTQTTFFHYDLDTGALTELTTLPENSGFIGAPAWSPDGSRLAFVRTTFEQGLERGSISLANMITQDVLGNLPPAENPFFQGNVLDVFDLSSGELQTRQLRAADGNGDVFIIPEWSTDGQTLLTTMGRPGNLVGRTYPIYTLQFLESSYIRFYDPTLQPTGVFDPPQLSSFLPQATFVAPDEIIYTAVYGLSGRAYYHNRATGEVRELSDRAGNYGQVTATNQTRQFLFTYSSFQNPPEIYRMGWDGQALAALTFFNMEIQQLSQIQVHELSFTLANGQVRYAYLIQPAGAPFPPERERMVVWQEGGPGGAMISQWGTNVENPYSLLPNFGISVLVLPLPGRVGWGTQFYNDLANARNFGAIDIDQGAEVVRQMIGLGYTASDRVGITGCSYGGYFTTQSTGRHPSLYAAANPQCGLYDTITEWQTGFTNLMSYLMGSPPTSEAAEYTQDSPGYLAENVTTPTLIFHGTDDFLPVNIAETYYAILEAAGTPVRMLKFVDEGHGLTQFADNQIYAAQEQIAWFRQYLAPSGAPVTTAAANGPVDASAAPVQQTIANFGGKMKAARELE